MDATTLLPPGTITFLLPDIEGSTQLSEQYPDAMCFTLAQHHVGTGPSGQERGGLDADGGPPPQPTWPRSQLPVHRVPAYRAVRLATAAGAHGG